MAVRDRKVTPDDLSAQEGVYFRGTCPGGTVETLWAFDHRSEEKKDGVRWWFADCYQPAEQEPLLVPFKTGELSKYLRLV